MKIIIKHIPSLVTLNTYLLVAHKFTNHGDVGIQFRYLM